MSTCEARIRKLENVPPKVDALQTTLLQMQGMQNDVEGMKTFVERSLPMLTHLQLCEGLNVIAGENMDKLQVFEKEKLNEILSY